MLEHLAERDRPAVKRRLRRAWKHTDPDRALADLELLASELERSHPGAAASLREGMQETLTLTRLGITGNLRKTLESTNSCESMIECVRRTSRNVKRWQNGGMALRWTAWDARSRTLVPTHHRLRRPRKAGRRPRARSRRSD